MLLGDAIGNILSIGLIIFAILYIFYLIIKIAVKHAIISLLPKIKSDVKQAVIDGVKKCDLEKINNYHS